MSLQLFDNFLFRTPFYPFAALSDFEKHRGELVFKEMLQIATPDLREGMEKGAERAQFSAYRYFQRACTRPTPFGLFAGCSMGGVGEQTSIQLSEQKKYRRVTRLDMNYICALTHQIERDKAIREQLCYFPNSSIYIVGDYLRYVECHYKKSRRFHQITQIERTEYLSQVLALASTGATFVDLANELVSCETTIGEAKEFLHVLIDSQVLVSELEPAVTNHEPFTLLISRLKTLSSVNRELIDVLSTINSQLHEIDHQPIGYTGHIYSAVVKNIEKTKVETEIKYLFQADMYKPVEQATVSRSLLNDVQQTLDFLNKINNPISRANLTQFKDNFNKRYEGQEMPLLFVLDNELGVGYGGNISGDMSPLVDDLVIQRGNRGTNTPPVSIQSVLMQKYQYKHQKEIELTDEDVKGSQVAWDDFPPTISVMCQIIQDDENGRSFFLQSAGGQSAANLLGRFCHLDGQILNHTLAITQKETQQHPQAIYAEIVHLPESRIGNILLRPILRPYEIPYLAKHAVSGENVIRPDDLYVSIKNNRIILNSKRLNKEIIPRMSTAHNYNGQNPTPVYHFLCDLQHQSGRAGLGFFWNETAQQLDYLPRVIYKNCILSQARWLVKEKEINSFVNIKDDIELLKEVKEWQIKREVPDNIVLADGDNDLFIDLKHPLSIRSWLSVVKKRQLFKLEEFLFNPVTAVVHSQEGVFTNEFIFAFYKETSTDNT